MATVKVEPTYIKSRDKFFMDVAKTISQGSNHPRAPGACIIVRDNSIIGDGRTILTGSKVEIDCVAFAIAVSSKRGTPTAGSIVYTTRYPFSTSVFQLYMMGVKRIVVLAHEWEPYYKDEFRRAARLARELSVAIEPLFEDDDPRFNTNTLVDRAIDLDLYTDANPFAPDEYDPPLNESTDDETTSV